MWFGSQAQDFVIDSAVERKVLPLHALLDVASVQPLG